MTIRNVKRRTAFQQTTMSIFEGNQDPTHEDWKPVTAIVPEVSSADFSPEIPGEFSQQLLAELGQEVELRGGPALEWLGDQFTPQAQETPQAQAELAEVVTTSASRDVPVMYIPPPTDLFTASNSPLITAPHSGVEPDFIDNRTGEHAAKEYPGKPVLTDRGIHIYTDEVQNVEVVVGSVEGPAVVTREEIIEQRQAKMSKVKESNKAFVGSQAAKMGTWVTSWWHANNAFARANNQDVTLAYVERPDPSLKWFKKLGAVAAYGAAKTGAVTAYGAKNVAQGVRTGTRTLYFPAAVGANVYALGHDKLNIQDTAAVVDWLAALVLATSVFSLSKHREVTESHETHTYPDAPEAVNAVSVDQEIPVGADEASASHHESFAE